MEKNYKKNFRKIMVNGQKFIVFKENDNAFHYFSERSALICSYINGQILETNINGTRQDAENMLEVLLIDFDKMEELNNLTKYQFHHMMFASNSIQKEFYAIFSLFPVCILSILLNMFLHSIGINQQSIFSVISIVPILLIFTSTKVNGFFFKISASIIEKISPKVKKLISVK